MTTAIICDDEPRLAQALREQLAQTWPELQVLGMGHSGGEALQLVAEHAPDIAFLDIRMPGLSGIEVARQLAGGEQAVRVVFVTAYDAYAIEAFEARALDYLLKPVKSDRLLETVTRLKNTLSQSVTPAVEVALRQALAGLKTPERKYLRWLNCGQGAQIDVLAASEVLCFQSRDKYTAVLTADKERYIRMPLKDLLDELDPDEFWQVHRSSVIRVSAIDKVLRDELGRMHVRLRGLPEAIAVSGAFTGRFKQL